MIATADALTELARSWEDDAKTHQRYDPADPKARVLARCAEDLRRTLGATSPEWAEEPPALADTEEETVRMWEHLAFHPDERPWRSSGPTSLGSEAFPAFASTGAPTAPRFK